MQNDGYKEENEDSDKLKKGKKNKYYFIGLIMVLAVFAILFLSLNHNSDIKLDGLATTEATLLENQLIIEEYSDFQCPYCKRVAPTVQQLKEIYGDKIKIEYKHYPLPFHEHAQKAAEASECARDQGKFWEYHNILFENQQKLDIGSLKKYAEDLGLETGEFNSCLINGEKTQLVTNQMAEGSGKGVSGTPAFIIGGELISGALPIDSFIPVIENALGGNSDVLDKLYADEPAIEFTVLTDKTCKDCDTSQIISTTKKLFHKLNMVEVDVNSAKGKELVKKNNLERIPSYLFSSNVIEVEQFKQNANLQKAFIKTDYGYKIVDGATGATHFIDSEKQTLYELKLIEERNQMKQKLGIGDKPQIDFFVMSYCPYGNLAEEAIKQVYDELGEEAVFVPRYVIYSDYRGGGPQYCLDPESKYCSMHGIQELRQNIRERCTYELYGTETFFEFTLAMNQNCNAQNADECWKSIAGEMGIGTTKISECEDERGLEFVKEDKELNVILGVSGSPAVFINGESYAGVRTSQGYMAALCGQFDDNDKPMECNNMPIETKQQTAPVGGCG